MVHPHIQGAVLPPEPSSHVFIERIDQSWFSGLIPVIGIKRVNGIWDPTDGDMFWAYRLMKSDCEIA